MAYKKTGTEFVLKGFGQFINGLKQINREYNNVNKTASVMASKVADAGEKVTRAQQRQEAAGKKLAIAEQSARLATEKLNDAVNAEVVSYQKVLSASIGVMRASSNLAAAQDDVRNSAVDTNTVEANLASIIEGTKASAKGAIIAIVAKTAALAALNVGAGILVGTLRTLWGAIGALGSKIKSAAIWPFQQLADIIKGGVSIAFGVLIRDSIRGAIDQLGRLRDALVKVVAEFQTLEVRIENLVAREMRLSGAVTDVAESFNAAVGPAAELSNWIRQLSLKVPFDVSDIANTTAFSMAMGFATDEAKALTLSIANFAAGMGLSSEKMQSIVFNFGQMKAAGKVTGTEMRDLARGAFFPLTDVLDETAKLMGVNADNIQEFRKQAAAGQVPIEAFFKAFQNVVARDFPDAVEKMGKTLPGVVQRFKNFLKTIFGIEILGPMMKKFAEDASNALDKLMTPAVQRAASMIGYSLVLAFDTLKAAGREVVAALNRLAQAFGFTGFGAETAIKAVATVTTVFKRGIMAIVKLIDDLAIAVGKKFNSQTKNFATWGANLINSFAAGMARAIGSVINVLTQLGKVIAWFLEAHSPPKLLPKLGQWGAAAMTEYIKGWKNADFSAFNTVADKVESFVRSLTKDIVPELDVVPTILQLRENIAKMVSGDVNIGDMFKDTGLKYPQFIKYAKLVAKVAQANKEVEKAQAELNRVTEKYDKILEPLNRQLDRLTDRGDEIDATRRITQLRLILADVNASAGDKERARNEIARLQLESQVKAIENEKEEAVAAAEDKVSAAEEHLATLEDELEAQEALIDVQIKTNELIKEQLDLLEKLKDKGGAGGIFDSLIEDLGFGIEEIGKRGQSVLENVKRALTKSVFDQVAEDVNAAIDDILSNFDDLEFGLSDLKDVWSRVGDDFGKSQIYDMFRRVSNAAGDVSGTLDDLWSSISDLIGIFGDLIGVDFSAATWKDFIFDIIEFKVIDNLAVFNGILSGIAESLKTLGENLSKYIEAWLDFVNPEGLDEFVEDVSNLVKALADLTDNTQYFYDALEGFWSGYQEVQEERTRDIDLNIKNHKDTTLTKFQEMEQDVVSGENSVVPRMFGAIEDKTRQSMRNTAIVVDETINGGPNNEGIVGMFKSLSDKLIGKSIIPEMLSDIEGAFDLSFVNVLGGVDGFVAEFLAKIAGIAAELYALLDLAFTVSSTLKGIPKGDIDKGGSASTPIYALPATSAQSSSTVNNFTLNMPTTANPSSVARAFDVMSVMVG